MTVVELMHEIRAVLNKPEFINNIKRHGFKWNMVCASMDTIEDTQLAVEAYLQRRKGDVGHRYLEIYGLFQAMFLQQDALTNLADRLKLAPIRVWRDPNTGYVRTIRDRYFGHPTRSKTENNRGRVTYHGITRMSVGSDMLQGWTYPNFRTEEIKIGEVVEKHKNATETTLERILNDLQTKGATYMSQFTKELPVEAILLWIEAHTDDEETIDTVNRFTFLHTKKYRQGRY